MKSKTTTETNSHPIFAYLRRSTSKLEQSDSLIQQEDGIWSILAKIGLDPNEVRYFMETYSWFENKTRKQFKEMTKEILALKPPTTCVILVRDTSRLSRNPTDSLWIMNHLYGDNGCRRIIEKILYLDLDRVKEWNRYSDKEAIHKELSTAYYDSLDTKRKSIWGIILKLESGVFPYATPIWMEKVQVNGKTILRQGPKMPAVRRAFEMKAEWKSHKEICKFLSQTAGIRISDRELSERLFMNEVFIGEYVEKNTERRFTNILFAEWQTPISLDLWQKVQKVLWRKNSIYGVKQDGDVIAEKFRTESGKRMSKSEAKWWKYGNYSNNIENIRISELKVLNFFKEEMRKILGSVLERQKDIHYVKNPSQWTDKVVLMRNLNSEQLEGDVVDANLRISGSSDFSEVANESGEICLNISMEALESMRWADGNAEIPFALFMKDGAEKMMAHATYEEFANSVKEQFMAANKGLASVKSDQIASMKKELDDIKASIKGLTMKFANDKIPESLYKEMVDEAEANSKRIERQISELSQNSEMEEYFEKLPWVLCKTFELASNALHEGNEDQRKEDILKLLELTTFELTINNKKELKIKLFEVLDRLTKGVNFNLEAPSGVEPLSKALQASV